ncbi:MAG: relaxase/mobilization nuclease domain-containing protein [Gammaproteobacteria bacterium]
MTKRVVDLRSVPLLDVASYGRRGPVHRPALTHAEVAHATRTVRGVPEVVIKVSGGARTIRGVAAHLEYLETRADLETDDGAVLAEKGLGPELLKGWDLEIDEIRRHTSRAIAAGRKPPKLVHNLVFSMPKGTPPDRLHKAVHKFAVEKLGLQHRYAMALHTDQAHPHVHVVVKAVSERGERLNIRRATLREWRRDFAQYLREYGVEANATERAVRGTHHPRHRDGIFRAARRGESTFIRERVESIARDLSGGSLPVEHGQARLLRTRREVERGWLVLAGMLARGGMQELADQVRYFVARMPPAQTDRQAIAERLNSLTHRNPVRTI